VARPASAAMVHGAAYRAVAWSKGEDDILLSLIHSSLGGPSTIHQKMEGIDQICEEKLIYKNLATLQGHRYTHPLVFTLKPRLEAEGVRRPAVARPGASRPVI
jgi:hypothetical protein